MIVNIRGTHGSGKTTTAYGVMNRLGIVATDTDAKGTPIAYRLNGQVALIGKYTQACGGCDTIKTQDEVCARIRRYHGLGFHVIFEGILTSQIYGRYSDLAREFAPDYVFAFLDTPLDVAISRVRSRRAAAASAKALKRIANGGTVAEPVEDDFDPKNVVTKYNDVIRVRQRCEEDGHRFLLLEYDKDPTQQVLSLLGLGAIDVRPSADVLPFTRT